MFKEHIIVCGSIFLAFQAIAGWRPNSHLDTASPVIVLSPEELSNQPVDWLSLTQNLAQAISTARHQVSKPLGEGRLSILRQQPQFQGQNDSAIETRIDSTHIAIIDSANLLGMEQPSAAESVIRMLTTGRLGLGFGGRPGLVSELREDGSRLVGDEALNLYQFPISPNPIPIYSTDMFRLTSTLAREGYRLQHRGFTSFAPIASLSPAGYLTNEAMEAYQTQGREMEAAREQLFMIDAILSSLNGITTSGEVPPGSKGVAAGIGYGLLGDPTLTWTQKQSYAGELKGYLLGIEQPKAFMDLEYRTAYYRTADAWLKGETSQSQSFTTGLRDAAYFHQGTIQPSRPLRYVSYMAGYWPHPNVLNTIQLDPQTFPPIIPAGNELRQIGVTADGLSRTQRVFNVSGLKNITGATIWGSSLWLAGNSADNVNGAIWAYKDSDNDGLFDEATGSKAIEFSGFKGGLAFGRNNMGGFPFVLNRSMGDLYRLSGIVADKPTTCVQYGSISARTDIRDFGFSGIYAYGVRDWDRPVTRGMRWPVGELPTGSSQFLPWGDHFEPYNYAEVVPALGSGVRAGASELYITGTIGRQVTAYDINGGETALGSVKIDAAGRGVFHLGTALSAGHGLRFLDEKGLKSATCEIPPVEPLRFVLPETLVDGTLRLQAFGMPDRPYTFLSGTSLDAWQEEDCIKSSRFGSLFRMIEPAGPSRYYNLRRDLTPMMARSDTYTLAPGVRASLFLGYNDQARMDTTYELAASTGYHADLISLSTKGVLSFGALADVSRVQLSYRTKGSDGSTSEVAQVTINMDPNLLTKPPVMTNSLTGETFVSVPCLVLGDLHYPLYQFALRNSPFDACPDPHWHRAVGIVQVYPLESPNSGMVDPNPGTCGYGTYQTVPQDDFLCAPATFESFKALHP